MSRCTQWVDVTTLEGKAWATDMAQQCTEWADEGGRVWHWVAKWVCKAAMWVVHVFCTLWNWIVKPVCIVWTAMACTFTSLAAIFMRRPRRPRLKYLFVLMLENRSFDHMIGFSGITGTDAITGLPTRIDGIDGTQSNTNPVTGVTTFAATPADFKLSSQDKDPPHEFDNTVVSLAGNGARYVAGAPYPPIDNSGFIANAENNGSSNPALVMNCFSREQLPVLTALAEEFAVCDNWYASMPGPTWPNRFFIHAATSGGLDDSPSSRDVIIATGLDGYRFANGTIFDALEERCIDWQIFEGDEMPQVFAISGMNLYALMGHYTDFEEFAEEVGKKTYNKAYTFIEPDYGNVLPVISPADFTCGNSQHPLDDVTRGEKLIKDVYEALRKSPLWEQCALIVTYDEHGGFYDHARPDAATAPGDRVVNPSNVQHGFDFKRLGVRVPTVIASPLIKRNVIDHTTYDHTSFLATMERLFGLPSLTKRDAAAHDFLHLFSLATPRTNCPMTLPDPAFSGFVCDGDDPEARMQRDAAALAAGERPPDDMPMPRTAWGFLQIMARRMLTEMPISERRARKAVKERYRAIRTPAEARMFMHDARTYVRREKARRRALKNMTRPTERGRGPTEPTGGTTVPA